MLAYEPGASFGLSLRSLAVVACGLWGLDNNLTRPISGGDPVVKGLAASTVNLTLSWFMGEPWPAMPYTGGALGSLSYGASLICYIEKFRTESRGRRWDFRQLDCVWRTLITELNNFHFGRTSD